LNINDFQIKSLESEGMTMWEETGEKHYENNSALCKPELPNDSGPEML
jgi:hypothetical protein